MARAIWTGSITFGLVSIPVGLHTATGDHTVHFHQFERGTSDRVRNKRVNERTGDEVEFDDIVKGADVGDGEHVVIDPEELDAIAPGRSRNLEISDFVELSDIDPIWYQRTYRLAPTEEQYARPYALLRRAMEETGRAGIGTFVMRGKEYLAAVRPDGDLLVLQTLFFADEVRDTDDLDVPGRVEVKGKELQMATSLIDSMSTDWDPTRYRDTYRDRVEKLIEDKVAGNETVVEAEPPDATEMSDLLAALERSVEQARGRTPGTGRKKAPGKKTPGTKSPGKKPPQKQTARKKAAGKKTGKAPDIDGATKTELTALAKKLDIRGRSSMTRDELAAAVRKAS
ncbi:non-homologous end joining protein Ku [Pseudonocardia sulfidoxydans NBRC 16205]|uniref:Non-homologous end joining protein Ku n=1 Tax=Pseudonocardia sulfidoxydans NBRC 16205 TaxID=1223511 RepID=A0A511DDM6_9PSEU|nr:Ku protein [Pseudonocardia sulfidoxydans]GEL22901.1 non-homologous end joining protein Ku [Pseudonocardia sulfidoxydans NBRC 16205]